MQVPFSMAIGKLELMHVCFPKHMRMGTAGMTEDKETKEGKQKRVKMESKVGPKQRSLKGLAIARAYRHPGSTTHQSSG